MKNQKRRRRNQRKLNILSLVLVIILGCIISVTIISRETKKKKEETVQTIYVEELPQREYREIMKYVETEDSYNQQIERLLYEELLQKQEMEYEENINEENSLKNEELMLLAKIVYAEAGNQPFEGKVAVAAVVLNRVKSSIYPNSIKEVIFQKSQFSPVKNGKIVACGKEVNKEEIPESCIEAAEQALNGADPTADLLKKEAVSLELDPAKYAGEGALGFYNPDAINSKSELTARECIKCQVKIGDHIFYYKFG